MEKVNPKVIFEDSDILVCDKPAGWTVTTAETTKSPIPQGTGTIVPTLQDWLAEYFNLGKNLGIGARAGIVHRLDKDTSGVILIAKSENCFKFLQEQFAKRLVIKKYLTLVHGIPNLASFEVNLAIARGKFGKFGVKIQGKQATTIFKVLKKMKFGKNFEKICQIFPKNRGHYLENYAKFYSLLEANPLTGRTHQIRVHAKSARFPIVADRLYLPRKLLRFDVNFCPRLFLHAASIEFTHPANGKMKFESQLPQDLVKALQYLKEV